MTFNKTTKELIKETKDILERYSVLQSVFNMRYEDLSNTERNEVRKALFDLHDRIEQNFPFPQDIYRYILSNWNGPIVTEKVFEICDKLFFNNSSLYIKKTRGCGMTNLLLAYVMWVCLNEEPRDGNKEIWYVAPIGGIKDDYNRKFRMKISNIGNRPEVCNMDEVEFNGWRIHFLSLKSDIRNRLIGRRKPHLIIMDECDFARESDCNNFIEIVNVYGTVKTVDASSRENDEINQFVYFEEGKNRATINWFHDMNKCSGLRFESHICGINNIMKIEKSDIESVIGNEDYLKEMFSMGWSLKSNWLDNWVELTQYSEEPCEDKIMCSDESDQLEITRRIAEIVLESGIKAEIVGPENWDTLVNLFNGCKSMRDVEKIEKIVNFIIELKQRWENEKKNKEKEDIKPYINFLKDVFEL